MFAKLMSKPFPSQATELALEAESLRRCTSSCAQFSSTARQGPTALGASLPVHARHTNSLAYMALSFTNHRSLIASFSKKQNKQIKITDEPNQLAALKLITKLSLTLMHVRFSSDFIASNPSTKGFSASMALA
eukprot:1897029-Amphidinium_carterae.1